MNKVTTINLNGRAYQLEESGYDALRVYLLEAEENLKDNPDKKEIMADLEQAVADKCDKRLSMHKTVVTADEIKTIIGEMGPVKSESADSEAHGEHGTHEGSAPKRLYRISEGEYIGGVCTGLAAYFNIDVTIIRIIFVILTILTSGGFLLAYFIMMVIIPHASTSEEYAAAHGESFSAQDLVDRFKEGIQNIAHKKEWKKHKDEWKRKWRNEKREHRRYWAENWGYASQAGAGIATPFLSLVNAFISIIWIFALISLITTGAIFGWMIPASLPLWAAFIILVCLYNFLIWPLRAIRQASYYHSVYGWAADFRIWNALDSLLWLVFVAGFLWLAYTYIPQAHALLDHFTNEASVFFNSLKK